MNFMHPLQRCLSILGLSLALAACDTAPTLVDQHFGLAVERARTQQSQPTPTNSDTDGAVALTAVSRYQQSFQTPTTPHPIFNIGLGAASAP